MSAQSFLRPAVRLLVCALLLSLVLPLAACGGQPAALAASMHLKKTEGSVDVADGAGNALAPAENLSLYSGYTVATQTESYAWINLDAVKLAKMDAESAIEIVKDETMEISTSSLLVGIRGTCGWVTQNTAALLEGTVSVTAAEQTVTVNAGEMAVLTEAGALEVKPFSAAAVPAFVRTEVLADTELAAEVLEAAGMDLSQTEPETPRYAEAIIAADLDEVLYTEWVDFANDGAPELLVLGIQKCEPTESYGPDRDVRMYIFLSDDVEAPIETFDYMTYAEGLFAEAENRVQEHSWSLVEADGRQFLEIYSYFCSSGPSYEYHDETARYYGFDAEGNWFSELIHYTYSSNDLITGMHSVDFGQPYGSEGEDRDCDPDDFAATRAGYSAVKQLVFSPDGVTAAVTAP